MSNRIFFDRRSGNERRIDKDQRNNPRLDLSHKRRRKQQERRNRGRNLCEDFDASNKASQTRYSNRLTPKH